jgi:diguanylate cyclase (GGDEF)-like protein
MNHPIATDQNDSDLRWSWPDEAAAGPRGLVAEILTQVSMEALQGDSLETVLQRTVDCLVRHLPIASARICLLNDECTHVVQEVWAGIELDLPGQLPRPVALGASGRCISTGRSQLIADVELDADYVARNERVKSEFQVPVRHRGCLHGILTLESTFKNFFTPGICAMFDAVAAQIAGAVHLARALRELEIANRKLEKLSMSDGLTGVANRRGFDLAFAREWAAHGHRGESMALLLVDVDCFKALNDALGHVRGDECLRELARTLTMVAHRAGVHLSRYGGEEFVLLLAGGDLAEARTLAETLRRRVEALAIRHPTSPVAAHVTVSIGVSAVCPQPSARSQLLIMSADRALYAAKAAGRNCVVARPCASH